MLLKLLTYRLSVMNSFIFCHSAATKPIIWSFFNLFQVEQQLAKKHCGTRWKTNSSKQTNINKYDTVLINAETFCIQIHVKHNVKLYIKSIRVTTKKTNALTHLLHAFLSKLKNKNAKSYGKKIIEFNCISLFYY